MNLLSTRVSLEVAESECVCLPEPATTHPSVPVIKASNCHRYRYMLLLKGVLHWGQIVVESELVMVDAYYSVY